LLDNKLKVSDIKVVMNVFGTEGQRKRGLRSEDLCADCGFLKKEAMCSSETLVTKYKTTW
jgi:hypothetical protein